MRKQLDDFETNNVAMTKTVKENTDYIEYIRKKIREKADQKQVTQIAESLTLYATYNDYKDLYKKIVP